MQPDSCDDHRYDDIIHLPHHVSAKHPHMPASDRAAQFAPFAALTGLGAAITETGRLTDEKTELDESEMMALNETLNAFAARLDEHPVAMFTYFQPDEKKSGGAYVTVADAIKKIDTYERIIILQSGTKIPMDDIIAIADGEQDEMR